MLRIPVVHAVGNSRVSLEKGPHTLHLVVCERIHWVNQHGADAGSQRPGRLLLKQFFQNRQQKALGFAGTGSGSHHKIFPRICCQKRRFLVQVQRPVQLQLSVFFRHRLKLTE